MSLSPTLQSVHKDARQVAALRKLTEQVWPDGDEAAAKALELMAKADELRDAVLELLALGEQALGPDADPDALATLASYSSALFETSLHSRVGFLAMMQAQEIDARRTMQEAEGWLRLSCRDVAVLTDELSLTLNLPVEQARALAVWQCGDVPQQLSRVTLWHLVEQLDEYEKTWTTLAGKNGIDRVAELTANSVSQPWAIPERDFFQILSLRVRADVVSRAGYRGPLLPRMRIAEGIAHRELLLRLEVLQPYLRPDGRPDTSTRTLRAGLFAYAVDLSAPPKVAESKTVIPGPPRARRATRAQHKPGGPGQGQ